VTGAGARDPPCRCIAVARRRLHIWTSWRRVGLGGPWWGLVGLWGLGSWWLGGLGVDLYSDLTVPGLDAINIPTFEAMQARMTRSSVPYRHLQRENGESCLDVLDSAASLETRNLTLTESVRVCGSRARGRLPVRSSGLTSLAGEAQVTKNRQKPN